MNNSNKVILGLIGAAAVGVALGMLLAPEKGGEVRQKIADTASDFASKIGDYITNGKEKLEGAGENIAGKARTFANDVSNRSEGLKNKMA